MENRRLGDDRCPLVFTMKLGHQVFTVVWDFVEEVLGILGITMVLFWDLGSKIGSGLPNTI